MYKCNKFNTLKNTFNFQTYVSNVTVTFRNTHNTFTNHIEYRCKYHI